MCMISFLGKKIKGQIALEYLVIIAFALLLAAPIIFSTQNSSVDLTLVSRSAIAKNALSAIREAVELVYSQGEPARTSIQVTFPAGINATTINGREISINLNSHKGLIPVYEIVDFNVTGSIPITPGTHKIIVRAVENYVKISG